MNQQSGFFQALFDLSFTEFITTRLIKVFHVLNIIGGAIVGLVLIIIGFNQSTGAGLLMLVIGAPLAFVILVMIGRVYLELMIVAFRIADHTAEVARQMQSRGLQLPTTSASQNVPTAPQSSTSSARQAGAWTPQTLMQEPTSEPRAATPPAATDRCRICGEYFAPSEIMAHVRAHATGSLGPTTPQEPT